MVKHLPTYIEAAGCPIFQRDQFFCRNSSVSCRLFSPSTQIPPDALMAPLTVSIITTSTPTSSSFTICISQPAQNGHQKEIFANPKGKFQACPTELDVWESKNVQGLKSKNPPRLLAGRYFFGQDISDISGYLRYLRISQDILEWKVLRPILVMTLKCTRYAAH